MNYDHLDLAAVRAAAAAGRLLPDARIALACYEGIVQARLYDQAEAEFRRLLRQADLDDLVPFSRCKLTATYGTNRKGSPVRPAEDGEEINA